MEALGAVRIDCDKLGHEVYQPGAVAYHKVLEEFGSGVETSPEDMYLVADWVIVILCVSHHSSTSGGFLFFFF